MTRKQWDKLDPGAQTIWDSLPDQAKDVILERKRPTQRPRYKNNLHEMSAHDLLSSLSLEIPSDSKASDITADTHDIGTITNNQILAMLTHRSGNQNDVKKPPGGPSSDKKDPGDITRLMSPSNAKTPPASVVVDGHKYFIKIHRIIRHDAKISYRASSASYRQRGALIDRGSNGGVAGADIRIISIDPHRTVDVKGIDHHRINDIRIVTAGAYVESQRGPIILIMHQYANAGKGKTIHFSGQLEWFKRGVDDRSKKVGGAQRITTPGGYIISINVTSGLPYIQQRPCTDDEYTRHPHVFLTSNANWDPSVLDHDADDDIQWYNAMTDEAPEIDPVFDEFGNVRGTILINRATLTDHFLDTQHELEDFVIPTNAIKFESHERNIVHREPNYERLCPHFGYLNADTVGRTFAKTTQYARRPQSEILRRHHKAQFPALNVTRRNEPLATGYVYSNTPAINDGSTGAQFFVGTQTQVCDIYRCKTDGEFLRTLQENVRRHGTPTKLISNNAQSEISKTVLQYLRALVINSWQSEPH
jgi:hypothetical protein